MTSELGEVAVVFCREVLGWKDAHIPTGTDVVFQGHGGGRLKTHDLNAVMEAMRGRIQGDGMSYINIGYWGYDPKWGVKVVIANGSPGEASNPDLCHALLSAFLEAHRQLKAKP